MCGPYLRTINRTTAPPINSNLLGELAMPPRPLAMPDNAPSEFSWKLTIDPKIGIEGITELAVSMPLIDEDVLPIDLLFANI